MKKQSKSRPRHQSIGHPDVDPSLRKGRKKQPRLSSCFDVIIECRDEAQQRKIFERMTADGYRCRLLFL